VASIRFQRPKLPPSADIERYFTAARDARWFSNEGPCHAQLTGSLSKFLAKEVRVVLTANATLGLMIALRSLLETNPRGSLVPTPSFTFPATAQAICWCGLRPLWVDVESDGWHLDPDALRSAFSTHGADIAGVVACSTFGTAPSSAQSSAWQQICASAGVPLLVDSAAGFGSRDEEGGLLGAQGDAEVFSFHATKPFAIGEGGVVATRNRGLAERMATLANFGLGAEDREICSPFGLNAKMSEVQAATGLAVLDTYEGVLQARGQRAELMRGVLEPLGYRFQAGAGDSAWQFVPVLAPTVRVRDEVLARASAADIEIRRYHAPLHRLAAFEAHATGSTLPVTEELASMTLSLPLANDLSEEEMQRICDLLVRCANASARKR
jgi:dTDP-4-amino-4,6-dideoxygalactose transaminase